MSSMKERILLFCIVLVISSLPLFSQETGTRNAINFSSDYTRASLHDDMKSLLLSGSARIETGSTTISADAIEIYGAQSRYVSCTGGVNIIDGEQGISVRAEELYYDRNRSLLRIDGWAEMEDTANGIIAKAAYLENSQETGISLLQISVKIYKHTEDGPMVCMTDSAVYDSRNQTLAMTGNSVVYWKGSSYEASQITVNLADNEITLKGRVKGIINE